VASFTFARRQVIYIDGQRFEPLTFADFFGTELRGA
jgi:hypothetical protein